MRFFTIFLSLDYFLEIAYSYRLQQFLTSSRGKTYEKKLEAQIWAKRAKIGPEISFFVKLVFLEIAYNLGLIV